jgi:hypothetical protein
MQVFRDPARETGVSADRDRQPTLAIQDHTQINHALLAAEPGKGWVLFELFLPLQQKILPRGRVGFG